MEPEEQLKPKLKKEISKKVEANLVLNSISKYLDKFIISIFYLLFIVTLFYAVYGMVYKDLYCNLIMDNQELEEFVLTFAEHIFLYILPFSIILGFYSFYIETMHYKLNNRDSEVSINDAKKLLDASKTIFLSSVLSYTLIKTIQKLYLYKSLELINVISYGVFLLILMFFILHYHKSHKDK
tara:strand:+ start:370 stop:915 length:546 start_codon:yes stop_codon:yes gene_type:complete